MLLALTLVLSSVLPVTAFAAESHGTAAASADEDFIRVFHLDAGRKYFAVDQVKEIIDAISAVGYTHLELVVGNEGLRLLLDDMSVTVGQTTYSSKDVAAGIRAGNVSYSHAGEWTQAEMDDMIGYAASKHIEIIPLVNTPGHMNTILDAAEYVGISSPAYSASVSSGWWGSTSTKTSATTIDLDNSAAVAFTKALVAKYAAYFAGKGCTYFNLGADEYAADVHSNGSMGFGVMQSGDSTVEVIPALGHDHKTVVTAPTCTEAGYTTYTCACGDNYVTDKVAALGHSYTTEEVDGYLVYICDLCGDSYSESTGWIALSGSYVLDTDGIEIGAANKYIIVGADKDYALTLSGKTIGASKVVVNGDTIILDDASGYEFYFVDNSRKESGSYLLTQNGTNGVYHMGGNMYYGTDNKGYWHFGASSNGSYQLYDYDNSTWYLNYGYVWDRESVSRFAVSSNTRYVRLFKATEGYVRLSGETNQTWAHGAEATESAVLEKVLIQTSTDAAAVTGTAAVTASMVTWDKSFDGYTAGTYTATVTYNGEAIGTVTVTITGEHVYETTVVAPTCTDQGCTIHTCTECDVSYTDSYTDALGHNYSAEETGGHVVYTCDRCGDSYAEATISYQLVSSISSGSKYVITLYSGRNYYALSHKDNRISAVQVTVSDGEITSEITEDLLWTYSNSKLSYKDGNTTYYLYAGSSDWWGGWWGSSATLNISTYNSSNVSFSRNRLKVGSYYLRYSNGSISVNQSAGTTYLFVETEE